MFFLPGTAQAHRRREGFGQHMQPDITTRTTEEMPDRSGSILLRLYRYFSLSTTNMRCSSETGDSFLAHYFKALAEDPVSRPGGKRNKRKANANDC